MKDKYRIKRVIEMLFKAYGWSGSGYTPETMPKPIKRTLKEEAEVIVKNYENLYEN